MTAKSMKSGLLDVFATPMMIACMENCCLECVRPQLDEGMSTVGTAVDIKHVAATPVGMQVCFTCRLEEIDRRRPATTVDFGGGYGGSRFGGQGYGQSYRGQSYVAAQSTHSHEAFRAANDRPTGSRATVASAATKPAAACSWKVGDRVGHASFGEGVITAITPMAGDTLLVIQFDRVGQKKLMANYAKLTAK
jgi:hypothetical protein